MNWQMIMNMKKIDARVLKEKHRLELVMQEFGEQFEISSDRWRSKTTPGLVIDTRQQKYERQLPGMDKVTGDLFAWLKWRFGWSFKQTVAYLQKRNPDSKQDAQPGPIKSDEASIAKYQSQSSEYPDEEKESSGLYECGVGYRNGKTYFYYLLKPFDGWQERALEIGGEEMREYFTWKANDLLLERDKQPSRFLPVQDMEITICDECEKTLEWWWKQKPTYGYKETLTPGCDGVVWKQIRIIDEPQVYAFEYERHGEIFCICENCKRKKINYREALDLLYRSARKREAANRER